MNKNKIFYKSQINEYWSFLSQKLWQSMTVLFDKTPNDKCNLYKSENIY